MKKLLIAVVPAVLLCGAIGCTEPKKETPKPASPKPAATTPADAPKPPADTHAPKAGEAESKKAG